MAPPPGGRSTEGLGGVGRGGVGVGAGFCHRGESEVTSFGRRLPQYHHVSGFSSFSRHFVFVDFLHI